MCEIESTRNNWYETVNDISSVIGDIAEEGYNTFLEKCLQPYGINRSNIYENAKRVAIEETTGSVSEEMQFIYQRVYVDNHYAFTIICRMHLMMNKNPLNLNTKFTYERMIEQNRLPKEPFISNEEAAHELESWIANCETPRSIAVFNKAIEALKYMETMEKRKE